MKVAILCGGRGTRIREVSELLPKPMVPIGDRPILWHIMKIYAAHGINEFILLLGYKGHSIREFFLNFGAYTADVTLDLSGGQQKIQVHSTTSEPWKVTLVDTGENSMTGARLWRARKYLENEEDFCLTYGDGVGNIDVGRLLQFHKSHGKVATVTGVQPPGRFGELKVDGSRVLTFNEKPQASGGHINGGFFVLNRKVFSKYLSDREDLVLEKEPLEGLAKDAQLEMFRHDGFWQPMDTPREFQLLNDLWASHKAPWQVWK
jgi:glucose-1-phosphate cytidylyltransferase